jgi:hypothetical protein
VPSFGFEFQEPWSAFTSWRARIRDPKTFPLAAHNQELVLRHVRARPQACESAPGPKSYQFRARVRALWGLSGWRGNERIGKL